MRTAPACDSTVPLDAPVETLVVALVALALGPVVYVLCRPIRWAFTALDGFVLTAVGALVLLHVLPSALATGGLGAVLFLLLGLALPLILHRLERINGRSQVWVIAIGLTGLAAHSAADGAGLVAAEAALSWAIVLHRIPAGLFVWWLVRPAFGVRAAAAVLIGIAAATISGFALAASLDFEAGAGLAMFEAFIGGALLHVLAAHHPELHGDAEHAHSHLAELGGAILGVVIVLLLPEAPDHHAHGLEHFGERFLAIALNVAPWAVAGYLLAGIFVAFLPRWSIPAEGRFGAIVRGIGLGAPLSVLSCGARTQYQKMVDGGSPTFAGVAFLAAAPALGIEALLVSVPLLGPAGTLLRIGGAVFVAVVAALVVGRRTAAFTPASRTSGVPVALRFGFVEVVDHTIGWLVFGIAIAAAAEPGLLDPLLDPLPAFAGPLLFALISVPFYVCAAGATPLAAGAIVAGASFGGALAFLLAGAITNLTTLRKLTTLHGRGTALRFGAVAVLGAAAVGWGVDLLPPPERPMTQAGPMQLGAGVFLALLLASSLVRRGLRHFLLSVLRAEHEPAPHDHHHHHHH